MKLRAFASARPETAYEAATVAEWTGSEPDFIENKIGIATRRFLGPNERGLDLAAAAARALDSQEAALSLSDVGALVVVTQTPDQPLPHMSALLQSELELPKTCAAFDLNLGCSGWVYGLGLLKGLMVAEGIEQALLVTCDPYSKIMRKGDRDTVSVFGDGAAATWLDSRHGAAIGKGDYGTDGGGAENLIVKSDDDPTRATGLWRDDDPSESYLRMNGRAIFNFMMTTVPKSIDACLERNELTRDDIDVFALHQASHFMVSTLAKRMKLTSEQMPVDISDTGNTVSSSIPILLEKLGGPPALAGKTVLVSGFGVGLSWASNILRFEE